MLAQAEPPTVFGSFGAGHLIQTFVQGLEGQQKLSVKRKVAPSQFTPELVIVEKDAACARLDLLRVAHAGNAGDTPDFRQKINGIDKEILGPDSFKLPCRAPHGIFAIGRPGALNAADLDLQFRVSRHGKCHHGNSVVGRVFQLKHALPFPIIGARQGQDEPGTLVVFQRPQWNALSLTKGRNDVARQGLHKSMVPEQDGQPLRGIIRGIQVRPERLEEYAGMLLKRLIQQGMFGDGPEPAPGHLGSHANAEEVFDDVEPSFVPRFLAMRPGNAGDGVRDPVNASAGRGEEKHKGNHREPAPSWLARPIM
jgi:hypothetical protein